MPSDERQGSPSHPEPPADDDQKTSGLGTPEEPATEACRIAHEAGSEIVSKLGPTLGRSQRMKALVALRRVLFPPKRPGRKRKELVTAAHRNWKDGVRGLALFRVHIPGWEKHSRWRRKTEERALMDAIHTRDRRERKRTANKNAG
jgi:hypothetical protein